MIQAQKDLVEQMAKDLCTPNNTVTTLEIKLALIKKHPHFFWTQDGVSNVMRELSDNLGKFKYDDTGIYRIYSLPGASKIVSTSPISPSIVQQSTSTPSKGKKAKVKKPKLAPVSINRKDALKLIENAGNKFFSLDGEVVQLIIFNKNVGYFSVRSVTNGNQVKTVWNQTFNQLKIDNQPYNII